MELASSQVLWASVSHLQKKASDLCLEGKMSKQRDRETECMLKAALETYKSLRTLFPQVNVFSVPNKPMPWKLTFRKIRAPSWWTSVLQWSSPKERGIKWFLWIAYFSSKQWLPGVQGCCSNNWATSAGPGFSLDVSPETTRMWAFWGQGWYSLRWVAGDQRIHIRNWRILFSFTVAVTAPYWRPQAHVFAGETALVYFAWLARGSEHLIGYWKSLIQEVSQLSQRIVIIIMNLPDSNEASWAQNISLGTALLHALEMEAFQLCLPE